MDESESAATNALEEQKKILKFINNEKNIATSSVASKNGKLIICMYIFFHFLIVLV